MQASKVILKTTNYQDDCGRRIIGREIVFGEVGKEFVPFVGIGRFRVPTPQGVALIEHPFPIKGAATIEEAFTKFDDEFQEMKTEFARPKLLIPNPNVH